MAPVTLEEPALKAYNALQKVIKENKGKPSGEIETAIKKAIAEDGFLKTDKGNIAFLLRRTKIGDGFADEAIIAKAAELPPPPDLETFKAGFKLGDYTGKLVDKLKATPPPYLALLSKTDLEEVKRQEKIYENILATGGKLEYDRAAAEKKLIDAAKAQGIKVESKKELVDMLNAAAPEKLKELAEKISKGLLNNDGPDRIFFDFKEMIVVKELTDDLSPEKADAFQQAFMSANAKELRENDIDPKATIQNLLMFKNRTNLLSNLDSAEKKGLADFIDDFANEVADQGDKSGKKLDRNLYDYHPAFGGTAFVKDKKDWRFIQFADPEEKAKIFSGDKKDDGEVGVGKDDKDAGKKPGSPKEVKGRRIDVVIPPRVGEAKKADTKVKPPLVKIDPTKIKNGLDKISNDLDSITNGLKEIDDDVPGLKFRALLKALRGIQRDIDSIKDKPTKTDPKSLKENADKIRMTVKSMEKERKRRLEVEEAGAKDKEIIDLLKNKEKVPKVLDRLRELADALEKAAKDLESIVTVKEVPLTFEKPEGGATGIQKDIDTNLTFIPKDLEKLNKELEDDKIKLSVVGGKLRVEVTGALKEQKTISVPGKDSDGNPAILRINLSPPVTDRKEIVHLKKDDKEDIVTTFTFDQTLIDKLKDKLESQGVKVTVDGADKKKITIKAIDDITGEKVISLPAVNSDGKPTIVNIKIMPPKEEKSFEVSKKGGFVELDLGDNKIDPEEIEKLNPLFEFEVKDKKLKVALKQDVTKPVTIYVQAKDNTGKSLVYEIKIAPKKEALAVPGIAKGASSDVDVSAYTFSKDILEIGRASCRERV